VRNPCVMTYGPTLVRVLVRYEGRRRLPGRRRLFGIFLFSTILLFWFHLGFGAIGSAARFLGCNQGTGGESWIWDRRGDRRWGREGEYL
jgi:hypothetical protein